MRRAAIALAGVVFVTVAAHAQEAPAGSAERGRSIYLEQLCQSCHGTIGQGGGVAGPKIAPQPLVWPAFARQTRVPRQAMPPYSVRNLPGQDLADVYAYLVSMKPGLPAKDIPQLSGN